MTMYKSYVEGGYLSGMHFVDARITRAILSNCVIKGDTLIQECELKDCVVEDTVRVKDSKQKNTKTIYSDNENQGEI